MTLEAKGRPPLHGHQNTLPATQLYKLRNVLPRLSLAEHPAYR